MFAINSKYLCKYCIFAVFFGVKKKAPPEGSAFYILRESINGTTLKTLKCCTDKLLKVQLSYKTYFMYRLANFTNIVNLIDFGAQYQLIGD